AGPSTTWPARSRAMPCRCRSRLELSRTPAVWSSASYRHIRPMSIVRRSRGRNPRDHPGLFEVLLCYCRPGRDMRSDRERRRGWGSEDPAERGRPHVNADWVEEIPEPEFWRGDIGFPGGGDEERGFPKGKGGGKNRR